MLKPGKPTGDTAVCMDRQYRYQRYVYDVSRHYYLLGRDALLDEMGLQAGQHCLEVGCGTARNLLKLATHSPAACLYGVDASALMLEMARSKLRALPSGMAVQLRQGYAQTISPHDFGLDKPFDHILFSYVLSMIPDWQMALDHAFGLLPDDGSLHIVDFADMGNLPTGVRQALLMWLGWFNVRPQANIVPYLQAAAAKHGGQLQIRHLPGRYAVLVHYYGGRILPTVASDSPSLV